MKKAPFTMFYIEKDVFIAIPIEDDGNYDKNLVYILGRIALDQYKLFDFI